MDAAEVVAATDVAVQIIVAGGAGDFAGQHHIIALAACFEPAADIALGGGVGLGIGRHRVHFGGVDKIDAVREGVIQLLMGFGFAVLLAPSHAAQANFANGDAGIA